MTLTNQFRKLTATQKIKNTEEKNPSYNKHITAFEFNQFSGNF